MSDVVKELRNFLILLFIVMSNKRSSGQVAANLPASFKIKDIYYLSAFLVLQTQADFQFELCVFHLLTLSELN